MKKLFMTQFAIGVISVLVWSLLGTVPASQAATVDFIATDQPGPWFKCVGGFAGGFGCVPASVAKTESLAIIQPGDTVNFSSAAPNTHTVHTFTSLLWPLKGDGGTDTNADHMPFDQRHTGAFIGNTSVILNDQGLYVFVCKLHPFMLAAVIVDSDSLTGGLKLGEKIRLISYPSPTSFNTSSDLATRLLRTFFIITNPANYQDHNPITNPSLTWTIDYPVGIPLKITGGGVVDLKTVLEDRYSNGLIIPGPLKPSIAGVGEVWIDTEFEKTSSKTKPGTATAVDAKTWKVTKKVALPGINMNNPHNMWTNRNQTVIYQTQWFDTKLTVFNRTNGNLVQNIDVGEAPAHVMTRVDTDQVHVSINGGAKIVELSPLAAGIDRNIPTQNPGDDPAQPHAHWMSHDGTIMVTPNSNTSDSTRIDIVNGDIEDKTPTGTLPIATGMMPDASKYYVSNYLDSTITCISIPTSTPACKTDDGLGVLPTKNINLLLGGGSLANYDPSAGYNFAADGNPLPVNHLTGMSQSGALPIQTPVSPDGKWVVTANTLSGTITIIDTNTDTLVKVLPCSAGCHGVNFGAKKGGGYYAYVSSKFSNDLIIVDLSTQTIVGRVVLVAGAGTKTDDSVSAFAGMGGQGVLPIPLVYDGWVQKLPNSWKIQLTLDQKCPLGSSSPNPCPTLFP